jgi:hypothetical protein
MCSQALAPMHSQQGQVSMHFETLRSVPNGSLNFELEPSAYMVWVYFFINPETVEAFIHAFGTFNKANGTNCT